MRFRFCYGQDCPDWVLEQVTAVSKQSAIRLKALVSEIADHVVKSKICEIPPVIADIGSNRDRTDSGKPLSRSEMAASIAWILISATRSRVGDNELANELGQLGLPKEHATAIASVYRVKFADINSVLSTLWLRLYPSIDNVYWRAESPLLSSDSYGNVDPVSLNITLSIKVRDTRKTKECSDGVEAEKKVDSASDIVFTLSQLRLAMLIEELKQALQVSKALLQSSEEQSA